MVVEKISKRTKSHTKYQLEDGTPIPGVTTVLGILNKPALVKWANNLGLQGIDSSKYVDDKASIGTLAHQMIADYLRGEATGTEEYSKMQIDQAENSLLSFFEWEKNNHIKPLLVEEPLVSEMFRFGGTIDCFGKVNGKMCLLDFKTSSGIFKEMRTQVAAYRQLLIEHGHKVDHVTILRIGRTPDEGFEERRINELDKRWEIFQHALAIYNLQKEVRE